MDKSRLEDIIKGKLQGHKEAVDKDELWNSLGLEPEKKKRRAIWWLWLIPVFLIVAATIYTSTLDSATSENIQSEASAESKSAELIAVPYETGKLIPKIEQEELTSDNQPNVASVAKAQNTVTIKKEQPRVNEQRIPDAVYMSGGDEKSRSNIRDQNLDLNKAAPHYIGYKANNSNSKTANSLEETTNTIDEIINTPVEISSQEYQEKDLIVPSKLDSRIEGVLYQEIDIKPLFANIPLITDSEEENISAWIIDLEYGAINRNFEANDTLGFNTAAVRNNSEEVLDYLSVGIRYNYHLTSSFSVFGGLRYTQFNESMSYMRTDSTQVEADATVIFTDINGLTSTSTTNGIGYEIKDKAWTYQNQMSVLSIPAGIIYEQKFGRFSVDFEAAAEVKIFNSFSGEIQNSDGMVVSNPDYLNAGLGFAYSLGVFAKYQLNEKNYIAFGPNYRKYINAFTTDTSPLKQTYQTLGGRLSFVRTF